MRCCCWWTPRRGRCRNAIRPGKAMQRHLPVIVALNRSTAPMRGRRRCWTRCTSCSSTSGRMSARSSPWRTRTPRPARPRRLAGQQDLRRCSTCWSVIPPPTRGRASAAAARLEPVRQRLRRSDGGRAHPEQEHPRGPTGDRSPLRRRRIPTAGSSPAEHDAQPDHVLAPEATASIASISPRPGPATSCRDRASGGDHR